MPRSLDAGLDAAMDTGQFTPYFNVQFMDSDRTTVLYETEDILEFELNGLEARVVFHDPEYWQDFYTFRIQRGVMIAGSPEVVTSSNFWPLVDRHEKRRRTLEGHVFPNQNYSTAGDVTYHSIIDTVCAQFGFTASFDDGAAAWLNYQFLADGAVMTLHNARYFFTMLRVKYLVFATDGGDDTLFFYQAKNTAPAWPAGYTLVNARVINAPGAGATKSKSFLSKDETGTVHTSGTATDPIHNLGYLEAATSHPDRTWFIDTTDWIIQGIFPHLKYMDFDALRVSYDVVGQSIWPARVRELYSHKLNPSWQWQARILDVFGDTEGGALPANTIAAVTYMPLNVSNFHGIMDENDTNVQVAMETIDQHSHPGGAGDISGTGVVGRVAEFVTNTKTIQAAKIIGPATNILTITNAAACTIAFNITASKTLTLTATDNYTMTIPATGTVIMQSVATSAECWIGPSNTTGLYFKSGYVGIGTTSPASPFHVVGSLTALDAQEYISFQIYSSVDTTADALGYFKSMSSIIESFPLIGDTIQQVIGLSGQVWLSGAGTVTDVIGLRGEVWPMSGTTTNVQCLTAFCFNEGGSVTNLYGLYVGNMNMGSSLNYAIYTNTGTVRFGDDVLCVGAAADNLFLVDASANMVFFGTDTAGDLMSLGGGQVCVNPNETSSTDFLVYGDLYQHIVCIADTNATQIALHASALLGFYGAAAVARPAAYTQTYSTVSRTVANPTAATLTDNTGGSANTTLVSIGTTYNQTQIRDNFADLCAMVNKNTADYLVVLKVVGQILDDLQLLGLLA